LGTWTTGLNAFAAGSYTCTKNIVGSYANQPSMPAGNEKITPEVWVAQFTNQATRDYTLVPGSPYHNAGTDGADIGCDLSLLPGF
jgi:hypothetical protein